jgi:glycosyltransferase involved in cell wall biosynthesis
VKTARDAFTTLEWKSELIVCDNNSTDYTADIARAAGATVVFEPVNQIARARNRGAEAATGDWLLFIDADSHPSAGLFTDVVEQIKSDRLAEEATGWSGLSVWARHWILNVEPMEAMAAARHYLAA